MAFETKRLVQRGLYHPAYEHDNCGIGAIVNMKGVQTHATIDRTLKIVENLEHRAGKDAEGKTGDGVGILIQISHRFFNKVAKELEIKIGEAREYGIGMFFFPQEELKRKQRMKMFELMVEKEGMEFLGWREVPTKSEILGSNALACMPCIMQGFIQKPANVETGLAFDRKLYIVRRVFEQVSEDTYVVSLSSRTIVYKGMFLVGELRKFYCDLQDKDYESAIAITHSRFSTNTNPSWERAHPYRFIVHNGEINTIRGNVDKMMVREELMESEYMKGQLHKVLPAVDVSGSDSAMLDNTLEFLLMNGMELPHAVLTTIPEPWCNDKTISRDKKDFYQYHAIMMEPWDGPASILYTDGDVVGAILDRNGLRPSRFYITDEDELILSSEVGVADVLPEKIIKKDRLRPGKMLLIDTKKGILIEDEDIKQEYASRHPYGEWLDSQMIELRNLPTPNKGVSAYKVKERARLKKAFGYSYEDYRNTIHTMANTGGEPISAMGADVPIPVLSERKQPLFNYFKQQFAQVTNPPIDAIREELVIDTSLYLGSFGNLLEAKEDNCNVIKLDSPILTNLELYKLKSLRMHGFKVAVISILYYKNTSLEKAIDHMFIEVDKAYKEGANILILSDRGVDEFHVAIPSLLAISALRQYLVRTKRRTSLTTILESGEPRDVHHFAALLGFGATAINPYLAHESIVQLIENELLDKDPYVAIQNYNEAVVHGIVKIASKMGISTLQSYQGSKIFEAVGISKEVVQRYFTGTVSRIGGIGLKDIENQVDELHTKAFDPLGLYVDMTLESQGGHKYRSGKEEHLYNPKTIHLLQESVRKGDYKIFKQYSSTLQPEDSSTNIRNLFRLKWAKKPLLLEEVESAADIVKRFRTGAMSFGSISPESHETMAIAMNRLGGKSNSGEGGESKERLKMGADGVNRNSAIKQVASGRFGVTSEYLVSANEIQIKMAQGAKPGEGGHLPGGKVYPWVARTRNSTPGVSLISPPPHHDIYSIEDLAQLIFDLKNSNKNADISVKLASEMGVGTIASGVAKAGAGVILISGFDGGTGAAPRSSIHNAGLPWEIGLAETHQTLEMNGLRSRVMLEVDGKLMTGYDVLIAALLGADGFGFATAPLVAMGCVMMRVCNLDTCPVGIATQNPELRKNFRGKPEYVEHLMLFIAEELREYMAKLGIRTVSELVGRTDLLEADKTGKYAKGKLATVDLSAILENVAEGSKAEHDYDPKKKFDFELEKTMDETVFLKEFLPAMQNREKKTLQIKISNVNRSLGTILGAEITKQFGDTLEDNTYVIQCSGSGGQSFGAFVPKGLTMELTGDSNDHLGKGLCGGKIIVTPPKNIKFKAEENIIIGNVALYGATGGAIYINGIAGERFCVRNSGAIAVVEGVGNHGCEYMTGGRVVVLGETGTNFAAGMSGGIAYVLDERNTLYLRLNKGMVLTEQVVEKADVEELKQMIQNHVANTGSEKGKRILDNFEKYLSKFKKIIPEDYKKMMEATARYERTGISYEEAQIAAFYESKKN